MDLSSFSHLLVLLLTPLSVVSLYMRQRPGGVGESIRGEGEDEIPSKSSYTLHLLCALPQEAAAAAATLQSLLRLLATTVTGKVATLTA